MFGSSQDFLTGQLGIGIFKHNLNSDGGKKVNFLHHKFDRLLMLEHDNMVILQKKNLHNMRQRCMGKFWCFWRKLFVLAEIFSIFAWKNYSYCSRKKLVPSVYVVGGEYLGVLSATSLWSTSQPGHSRNQPNYQSLAEL